MTYCFQDAPGPVWQLGTGPAPHTATLHQLCGGDGSPPIYRSHRLHLHFSRVSLRRLNIHTLPGRCLLGAADTEFEFVKVFAGLIGEEFLPDFTVYVVNQSWFCNN